MTNLLKSQLFAAVALVTLLGTSTPSQAANYDSNINCFGCAPAHIAEAQQRRQACQSSRGRYNALIHLWNNKWRFESPAVRKQAKQGIADAKRAIKRHCR